MFWYKEPKPDIPVDSIESYRGHEAWYFSQWLIDAANSSRRHRERKVTEKIGKNDQTKKGMDMFKV